MLKKIIYLPDIWNCHSGYDFIRKLNTLPLKKINILHLDLLIIIEK